MNAQEIQARILYRDALMLVIDKPAGLPVHAGPGGGPNLERSFEHLRFGLPKPPALAHRLDRDTSGCPGASVVSIRASRSWGSCSRRAGSARPIGR